MSISYAESKSESSSIFSKFRYGGFIETKNSFDIKEDNRTEDLFESRNKVRLETTANLYKTFDFNLSIQGKYTGNGRYDFEKEDSNIDIYEAYGSWYGDQFQWKNGQQIIFWGKTDEINPTDNLNPQDLREYIILERENRKIPILASKFDYYIGTFVIEGIWIPFFKANEFAEEGSDWKLSQPTIPLMLQVNRNIFPTRLKTKNTRKPSKKLKNSEWGMRVSKTMSKIEYSFSYLNTWDDNPIYKRYFQLNPPYLDVIMEPEHKRQHILGADFNAYLENLGVRGEVMYCLKKYFQTEDMNDHDSIVSKPYLFYVSGIDYTLFRNLNFIVLKNLYINCQFAQQMIPHYDELIIEEKYRNLLMLQINNKYISDTLEIDIQGSYSPDDKDYRINPKIIYELIDSLKLTVGLEILGGNVSTPFGKFDNNDYGYMKTTYSF